MSGVYSTEADEMEGGTDCLAYIPQAYMEDHLRNKDRLMKEWEALCSYQAEPSAVSVAQSDANAKKNRCPDSVPCESRQLLHFRHN